MLPPGRAAGYGEDCVPRFDRNQNSADELNGDAKPAVAINAVLHDTQHPSALVLPIVSRP